MVLPLIAAAGAAIPTILEAAGIAASVGGAISSTIDLVRAFKAGDQGPEAVAKIVEARDREVAELVQQGMPQEAALAKVNERLGPELADAQGEGPSVGGSLAGIGLSLGGLGLARGAAGAAKAAYGAAKGGSAGLKAGAKAFAGATFERPAFLRKGVEEGATSMIPGAATDLRGMGATSPVRMGAAGPTRPPQAPPNMGGMRENIGQRDTNFTMPSGNNRLPMVLGPEYQDESMQIAGMLPQPGQMDPMYQKILSEILRESEVKRLGGRMYGRAGD